MYYNKFFIFGFGYNKNFSSQLSNILQHIFAIYIIIRNNLFYYVLFILLYTEYNL